MSITFTSFKDAQPQQDEVVFIAQPITSDKNGHTRYTIFKSCWTNGHLEGRYENRNGDYVVPKDDDYWATQDFGVQNEAK